MFIIFNSHVRLMDAYGREYSNVIREAHDSNLTPAI